MGSRRNVSIAVCLLVLFTAAAQAAEERGQWILVTPPALRPTAETLIARRQQQGWKCVVLDTTPYSSSKSAANDLQTDLQQRTTSFEGTTTILLLGAWLGDKDAIVPSTIGIHGRMKGALTDHGLGQSKPDGSLTVAVGRLPARSAVEARLMIAKLLTFEAAVPRTNQVNLIAAHPGGGTPLEKTIAENVIRSAVDLRLGQLDASWKPKCIMDIPNSNYTVATTEFGLKIQRMFEQPYLFTVYSGHSGPHGMFSTAGNVFSRSQFDKLEPNRKSDQATGVLVSCGCFGCQVSGIPPGRGQGQGHGLFAIRSANGPAAVIGAFGESYSAMGLMALDGLLSQTKSSATTKTLGEYWLTIQQGITQGKITPGEFLMHDMADGSRGKVNLAAQRLEHAEMWTLLGDPAMQIPVKSAVSHQELR